MLFLALCVIAGIASAVVGAGAIIYARREGIALLPMSLLGCGFFFFSSVIFLNVAGVLK